MTDPNEIDSIVDAIRPILAGHPPDLQGAALADLLAIWLAGHIIPGQPAKTKALRKRLLTMHVAIVRELIPVSEAMFVSPAGKP